MATRFPQWATAERRNHLLRLSLKHGLKCRMEHPGNAACMDQRHYYDGCAFEHESSLTESFQKQIDALRGKKVLYAGEHARLSQIQKLDRAYMAEVTRMRRECQIHDHYVLHIINILNEELIVETPSNAYRKALIACKASWKEEDRERRSQELRHEREALHDGLPGKYPGRSDKNGRWHDPVTLNEHFRTRPDYYLIQYHVSAISFQRMATIRIPSTYINLEVEIGEAFKDSPSPKRQQKRIFRGQDVPTKEEQNRIDELVKSAIEAYWASR